MTAMIDAESLTEAHVEGLRAFAECAGRADIVALCDRAIVYDSGAKCNLLTTDANAIRELAKLADYICVIILIRSAQTDQWPGPSGAP